ncbi:hypothetical protein RQP46_001978 [Phenoliferia psychrophenolica]
MRFLSSTFAAVAALAFASSSVALPAPKMLLDYWPSILSPTTGDVFSAGDNVTVTWDTKLPSGVNASNVGQTASIYLTYLLTNETGFHDERLLKSDVELYGNGTTSVTLPSNLTSQASYVVVLIGSSGDQSNEFTINALDADALYTVIEDLAIEEHRLACRRRAEGNLYRAATGSVSSNGFLAPSGSKAGSGSGPSPSKKEKDDALYDCMNCTRTIAAPRYASHLSSCMGLAGAGGTRRGESRRQAALNSNGSGKPNGGLTKLGIERAASVSSYASDEDAMSGLDSKKLILKLPSFNQNKSHSNPHDRPDSDSSADEDEKPRQQLPPRGPGPIKVPKKTVPFGRTKHPLAKGVESSGSDSSDGSGSD